MRSDNPPARLLFTSVQESLNGDPEFMRLVAEKVAVTIIAGSQLNAIERYWLTHVVLSMVVSDDKAAVMARPANTKGAPRRGRKGMQAAFAVLSAIDGGAKSIEEACEVVAGSYHRDAKTVKADWMKWREEVMATLSAHGKDGEQILREMLAKSRQA